MIKTVNVNEFNFIFKKAHKFFRQYNWDMVYKKIYEPPYKPALVRVKWTEQIIKLKLILAAAVRFLLSISLL